jgi:hypothetical protein
MIKITLTLSVISTYFTIYEAIMEILDEFDIKILRNGERWSNGLFCCNQLKKYRIPWCINASIDYSNKVAGIKPIINEKNRL